MKIKCQHHTCNQESYFRSIRKSMTKLLSSAPKYKVRSEFEMEKILHKYRVVARKQQIKDFENSLEYPIRPFDLMQYTDEPRRRDLLKAILSTIKQLAP